VRVPGSAAVGTVGEHCDLPGPLTMDALLPGSRSTRDGWLWSSINPLAKTAEFARTVVLDGEALKVVSFVGMDLR
jgi:hypothetical protein